MSDHGTFPVPASFADAHISKALYDTWYRESLDDPAAFWSARAKEFLTWDKEWDQVTDNDISQGKANWFVGGKLNVSVNCIDRHLPERADQTAFIWDGDNT